MKMSTSISTFAPVIIPTLNRYEHLKRCVESLACCTFANNTELVIGLDYPPSEKYFAGYNEIKKYIDTISGFKKITILTTPVNINPVGNINRLIEYVKQSGYDSYILTEDDNEFSPNFLDYINKGLEKYKNNPKVIAITGYNFPISSKNHPFNTFASQNVSAWGIARWCGKDEQYPVNYDEYCKKILKDYSLLFKIFRKDMRMINSLIHSAQTGYNRGDRIWTLKCLIEDKYCIYPTLSLVRNWGHDGSGEHCGTDHTKKFNKQTISSKLNFDFDEIDLCDNIMYQRQSKFLNGNFLNRIRRALLIFWRFLSIKSNNTTEKKGCLQILSRKKK